MRGTAGEAHTDRHSDGDEDMVITKRRTAKRSRVIRGEEDGRIAGITGSLGIPGDVLEHVTALLHSLSAHAQELEQRGSEMGALAETCAEQRKRIHVLEEENRRLKRLHAAEMASVTDAHMVELNRLRVRCTTYDIRDYMRRTA